MKPTALQTGRECSLTCTAAISVGSFGMYSARVEVERSPPAENSYLCGRRWVMG